MRKTLLKQEKGAITLFVLLAILFFLIVIFSLFITSSNKKQVQSSEVDKIKKEYEESVKNIDQIYKDAVENLDITQFIEVGNYVDYNPTVSDKSGTPVEASKLKYSSPEGDEQTHGNGYEEQTFTATANTKWRVLDIGNETVTLISEKPIKKDNTRQDSGNFVMQGAIGYLYAEQELNEICKIYGYGYGADTSQVTKYSYGGPKDGELVGEITGSGARNITIEDINKQAGITENDYTTLDNNYGNTTYPTINIWYPTITTQNGSSGSSGVKNLKYTFYYYAKTKLKTIDIQNMIFNGNYWLASRCMVPDSISSCYFNVHYVTSDNTYAGSLCYGLRSYLYEYSGNVYAVRPVVTLKSNVIDINTDYEAEGHWNLK